MITVWTLCFSFLLTDDVLVITSSYVAIFMAYSYYYIPHTFVFVLFDFLLNWFGLLCFFLYGKKINCYTNLNLGLKSDNLTWNCLCYSVDESFFLYGILNACGSSVGLQCSG